jgi:RNA polymerase sigma-70 factor (ECF subfamily)
MEIPMDGVPDRPQLLAELGWLRRLARALAEGADEADDLVQEVWFAASQKATPRSLRGWLRTVLINHWRMRRRAAARRDLREHRPEGTGPGVGADLLLERAQLERRLALAALALADPERQVILLSYYEGCSSREIGQRLGMPPATVRWHLARALEHRELLLQLPGQP